VTRHPAAARLWPSFNVVELTSDGVRVEVVAFSPKKPGRVPLRRDLVRAKKDRMHWMPEPVSTRVRNAPHRVELDEARYVLKPSRIHRGHWDYACTRRISLHPNATLRRYVDVVHAVPDAPPVVGALGHGRLGRRVELTVGDDTRYGVDRALCRTLRAGARAYGRGTAFEWVGLLCRYGASTARLSLERPKTGCMLPFASIADLSTGRERPASLVTTEEGWVLSLSGCPPRTLLRIYWPLEP
jgi:hypothetical protein